MIVAETYALVQTVAPAIEPVLSSDIVGSANSWARDPSTGESVSVDLLIQAAREKFEEQTGRQLITATHRLSLDRWPCDSIIWIPSRAPWISVTGITYLSPTDGSTTTVAAADYRFDAPTGRIEPAFGESWPSIQYGAGGINVTFTAGYGTTAASVPAGIRLAIRGLVLDWLEGRALRFDVPPGVRAQFAEWRHGRLWG